MKYIGVTISGVLAGLGGAWLAIDIRAYNQDQVAGRGFQGLAALDLRQLAAGRHRRRRRAVRVRAVAHPAHRHRSPCGRCSSSPRSWRSAWPWSLFARRRAPQAIGALIMGALSLIYYLSRRRR